MGVYVFCKEVVLFIFDQIFIRIGVVDDLVLGKSMFMVEMLEV